MELVKILLKVLYLGLLYFAILMVVKPLINVPRSNLILIVLSLSVLLMYFTFDNIYDVITKNEIILKKNDEDEDEDEQTSKDNKNSTKIEIVDKVHKEASSDYLVDHTHKFVENKVFG
jgi:uncharacterized membrane protein